MIYIENVKLLPIKTTCQDLTVTSGRGSSPFVIGLLFKMGVLFCDTGCFRTHSSPPASACPCSELQV